MGAKVPVGAAEGRLVGTLLVGARVGTVEGAGDGPVGADDGGRVSPDLVGLEVAGDRDGDSEPVGIDVGREDGWPDWRVQLSCETPLT